MDGSYILPVPYPDELLYSVLTRYHLRSNNSSMKWTLREVYGTESVIPTIDLPSHLEALAIRNADSRLTVDQLIDDHTFYPYYVPFLTKDQAEQLRKAMKSSNGSGIHVLVGITASTVERGRDLLFCPLCYEDDIQQYGEPYWHRLHQLPGVKTCPVHREVLHRITYPISDRYGLTILPISRHMFESVEVADLSGAESFITQLIEITEDVQHFMESKVLPDLYHSRHLLLPRLLELGYATAKLRIRQQMLEEHVISFYGRELLMLLDSLPTKSDYTWLALATRTARRAVHPLRQLLLIRFLFGSFKSFMEYRKSSISPFGEGPWPCLNKAADHFREPTIMECEVTNCSDTRRPVGTFRCQCGFSYSRRGPDRLEADRYHRGRIKSFGSVWANKLDDCIRAGLSYRQAAEVLGVDTNTVIKYANGTPIDEVKQPSVVTRSNNKKRKEKAKRAEPRVNWELRDLELSWRVEEACKSILADFESKPVRISIASIGKKIGTLSLLEKHKRRLPITSETLDKYIESVSQFQIRRVNCAYRQMIGEWPIKKWLLVRKAGLPSGYSSEVNDVIDSLIGLNTIGTTTTTEVSSWLH